MQNSGILLTLVPDHTVAEVRFGAGSKHTITAMPRSAYWKLLLLWPKVCVAFILLHTRNAGRRCIVAGFQLRERIEDKLAGVFVLAAVDFSSDSLLYTLFYRLLKERIWAFGFASLHSWRQSTSSQYVTCHLQHMITEHHLQGTVPLHCNSTSPGLCMHTPLATASVSLCTLQTPHPREACFICNSTSGCLFCHSSR